MKAFKALVVVSAIAISGCAYNTAPYGASVANVEKIKGSKIKPVAVAPFTSFQPGKDSITCRAAGPVKVKPNFESYIQQAFIDELKLAAAYDPNSPIAISGKLEAVDFSSGISDGKWNMSLTVSNGKAQSFTTQSLYTFSGSFVADKACQEVAQAFGPAVQKLIEDVIRQPGFAALTQ